MTTSERFFRGDDGYVKELAARFMSSPDIYTHREREAEQRHQFR